MSEYLVNFGNKLIGKETYILSGRGMEENRVDLRDYIKVISK
jgi:hypothetical protein